MGSAQEMTRFLLGDGCDHVSVSDLNTLLVTLAMSNHALYGNLHCSS